MNQLLECRLMYQNIKPKIPKKEKVYYSNTISGRVVTVKSSLQSISISPLRSP